MQHCHAALEVSTDCGQHPDRLLFAHSADLTLRPALTARLLFQTHRSLSALGFGRDRQIRDYVLLKQAVARGNDVPLEYS